MNSEHEIYFSITHDERRDITSFYVCHDQEGLAYKNLFQEAHLIVADMLIARKPLLIMPSKTAPAHGKLHENIYFLHPKNVTQLPDYFMTNELFWEHCIPQNFFLKQLHYLELVSNDEVPIAQEDENQESEFITFSDILHEWSLKHGMLCVACIMESERLNMLPVSSIPKEHERITEDVI